MDRRLELHEILCEILGTRNVYFQAPENLRMNYPCIRYSLSDVDIFHANNKKYEKMKAYEVILITDDPDDTTFDDILAMDYCQFIRSYVSDGLNHFVFNKYF